MVECNRTGARVACAGALGDDPYSRMRCELRDREGVARDLGGEPDARAAIEIAAALSTQGYGAVEPIPRADAVRAALACRADRAVAPPGTIGAMQLADLRHRLRALGAGPSHEARVLRLWAQALPWNSGKRRPEDFLPKALREGLPALAAELAGLARLRAEHPGADGSARLLVDLADGQMVEAVLLPRDGLCVSTQVGCAVGCVFCMTGQSGLLRQLGSAEIVAQVALARQRRAVRKVVFMGMGEPSHNLDNVLEAIELLGHEGGIGHKNLVFSTVGDARVFERLPLGRVKPALALSLHSTFAERRAALMPLAPRIAPDELVAASHAYARATGYPLQIQWTLLAGINDGDDEVDRLIPLLKGRFAMLNLIPYNAVEGLAYERPPVERAEAIAQRLNAAGIVTRLRQSAGQDVDAGCGQLRARAVPPGETRRHIPLRPARSAAA